jgi:hypothetical protein
VELIELTLCHDNDGHYFIATYANNGGIEKWLAIPLDPIGFGTYEGRLQLVGQTL